ncbi:hypothetical protein M0R45_003363 [Rubus argutus]|uniref:NB-ARC domain-containing protein n=1 Tax=Rubus argutus TaxID=59490 RepID=A0AAW1YGP3_RUBAR
MAEIAIAVASAVVEGGPILPCYYVKQVQDVAYEIEDALDEFMFDDVLEHENSHALSKIIPQKLKKNKPRSKLSSKMNDITKKKRNAQILQDAHVQPTPSSSGCGGDRIWSNQYLAEGDELVGFEVLVVRGKALSQIKFTGAMKLKEEPHVSEIGLNCQRFRKKRPKGGCLQVQGQERCLVVLDDAWIKQDLKLIVKALPNGRIIITSRNSGVASLLYPKYIHDLSRGLSWEKAKELFCKKAFDDGQGDWPPELADWAKKILKRCEGMPLAISAIGTFLYSKKIPVDWKTLHDSLGSELCTEGSDLFIISRNLQASYRDLPNHLRSCFLYFSMFPDEEEEAYYSISRERLIRLWAAEKFVQPETGKTIEQAAEGYLNDLVERNLVVATKRESEGGRVRSCRVLNLVREINISRRRGFITVWEPDDYLSAEKIRRLSAHNGGIKKIKSKIHSVRTLLAFGQAISDLEVVLKTAKYLKVLDLEGTSGLKEFPEAVKRLILLNYLSLRKTDVERIPKSIKKNVLLETLDLKSTKVTELPEEIYKLKKLRHLLVDNYNVASHGFEGVEISKGVGDLSGSIHKLSLIKAKNTEIIKALGKLKDLRKLGLRKTRSPLIGSMPIPSSVSPASVLRGSLQELPKWIPKLTSLQKVGLHGSNVNDNPLKVLEALPNLIELNLVGYYGGEELVFRADQFKKLRTLIIEQFDQLTSFQVEDGALRVLRELNISHCPNLKSLPKGIGGINHSTKLFLQHMPDDLLQRFKRIVHTVTWFGTFKSFIFTKMALITRSFRECIEYLKQTR